MNKVLLVGRLVRNPEVNSTSSNIKFARFSIAVARTFGEDQADFIPIVAWRSQAEFVEKYVLKGALVSVEGRFNSNTYQNGEGTTVTRYEVAADRVQALETRAQVEARLNKTGTQNYSQNNSSNFSGGNTETKSEPKVMKFEEEAKPKKETNEVPWELDL